MVFVTKEFITIYHLRETLTTSHGNPNSNKLITQLYAFLLTFRHLVKPFNGFKLVIGLTMKQKPIRANQIKEELWPIKLKKKSTNQIPDGVK